MLCSFCSSPVLYSSFVLGINMAEREEMTLHLCSCEARNTTHVHCKCEVCDAKAVPTTTAWRHRSRVSLITDSSPLPIASELDNDTSITSDFFSAGTSCSLNNDLVVELSDASTAEDRNGLSFTSYPSSELVFDIDDEIMHDSSDADSTITKSEEELDEIYQDFNERENMSDSDQEGLDADNFDQFLEDAILRLVELKAQHGYSIKASEDILKWGGGTFNYNGKKTFTDQWPRSWGEVIQILERLGYKDAKCYWICLDDSHPCSYSLLNSKNDVCKYCGKFGSITYYYLSVIEKVKRWCMSPAMCKRMTAHWLEKDHWLNNEGSGEWG